jgi:hypothetical protein
MNRIATLALAALLLVPAAFAQTGNVIEHHPLSCIMADEMPVMQVQVSADTKGELRGYYRRTNSTDWCSVIGTNLGKLSSVTLPKFNSGDEIEYFFIVVDGKRVVAKSPQIYRTRSTEKCDSPFARHLALITIDCGNNGAGSIPSSMAAGFALSSKPAPNPASPDNPQQ